MICRFAQESDIESIAKIKVEGWQAAYRGIVDDEYLDALSVEKQSALLMKYPLSSFIVAETDGNIVGFCRISPGSHTDSVKLGCEIREIYVRPDLKRWGIGTTLFKYTVKKLVCRGYTIMSLCVFEKNASARKFYEKMGGKLKSNSTVNLSGRSYPAVEYVFDLSQLS